MKKLTRATTKDCAICGGVLPRNEDECAVHEIDWYDDFAPARFKTHLGGCLFIFQQLLRARAKRLGLCLEIIPGGLTGN